MTGGGQDDEALGHPDCRRASRRRTYPQGFVLQLLRRQGSRTDGPHPRTRIPYPCRRPCCILDLVANVCIQSHLVMHITLELHTWCVTEPFASEMFLEDELSHNFAC